MLAFVTALTFTFAPSDGLPVRPAKSVGMSAERLAAIDRVVNRGLKAGGFPGAAVVVGRRGASVFQKGYGRLGWTPQSPAVTTGQSIYDLASLTKVVGTTMAAMILYDEGRLELDAPVSRYLPMFSGGDRDYVTVRQLLTHRSGLPAGRDLWRLARNTTDAKYIVLSTPLTCAPGSCYIYSDLGADVLGWMVESITSQGLDAFLEERVFGPLGMNDTQFRPADSLRTRIAPTEVSPPRGYPIRGEVHDENCWAFGGAAGHAGLFGTAAAAGDFARAVLGALTGSDSRIAQADMMRRFVTRAGTATGSRALGWDTMLPTSSCGTLMSPTAFGHTGFTGTTLWIDPEREIYVVFLTNRVNPTRENTAIQQIRPALHDAVIGALDA